MFAPQSDVVPLRRLAPGDSAEVLGFLDSLAIPGPGPVVLLGVVEHIQQVDTDKGPDTVLRLTDGTKLWTWGAMLVSRWGLTA